VRGKECDGVASAGKLFFIIPYKMNRVYIRFRQARDRINSYNGKVSTELTHVRVYFTVFQKYYGRKSSKRNPS